MTHRLVSIFLLSAVMPYVQAQPLYPVVAKAEQKARDEDRRLILQTELAAEGRALAKAKTMSDSDAVHRHEENVKALQRELDGGDVQSGSEGRHRVTVKALRPSANAANVTRAAHFWDPYNRPFDVSDSSTSQRSESHE
jgi:hypothetical protein